MADLIRDAVDSDLPAIVEIYNASIPGRMATADLTPVTVESRLAWFQEHNPRTRPIWVIGHEEKLIAWISLNSFYGRPAYQATAEVSLYVAPKHQGRGIGSKLLSTMVHSSPEFGISTLLGFVFAHNHPSLHLCKKVGFKRWGLLPQVAEMDGQRRDLVIFGLQL
jgi:L-amino acid N-acyltransferase YncA